MHFKKLFDPGEYICAGDLDGKEYTVTISKVQPYVVPARPGIKSEKKPLLHFQGRNRPMICNVTNAKTIAQLYGPDTDGWAGRRITIYPTITNGKGGEQVECIRVRPIVPPESRGRKDTPPPEPERAEAPAEEEIPPFPADEPEAA